MIRLAALSALALAAPAHADQALCGTHDAIEAHVATGFGEARVTVALTETGLLLETYASIETGTWSILRTTPDGITCIIGFGSAFEMVADPVITGDPA